MRKPVGTETKIIQFPARRRPNGPEPPDDAPISLSSPSRYRALAEADVIAGAHRRGSSIDSLRVRYGIRRHEVLSLIAWDEQRRAA